jgi:hypothetical protein
MISLQMRTPEQSFRDVTSDSRLRLAGMLATLVACGAGSSSSSPPTANTNAVVVTSSVDFGSVDCGGSAAATIDIRGPSDRSINWRAVSIEPTDLFSFDGPVGGALSPGESRAVRVNASARATVLAAHEAVFGRARIEVDDPPRQIDVGLQFVPEGSKLVAPGTIDLGSTAVGVAQSSSVAIRNDGSRAVTLELSFSDNPTATFSLQPSSTLVDAGATVNIAAGFLPHEAGVHRATLHVETNGPVCGGVRYPSVVGSAYGDALGVSSPSVDFGGDSCGAITQGTRSLTIVNRGTSPFTWNAELVAGSASVFKVTPTTGTLEAGVSADLTLEVSNAPSAPSFVVEKLAITSGSLSHEVSVAYRVSGAQLDIVGASPREFGDRKLGSVTGQSVEILNTGDQPITLVPVGSTTEFSFSALPLTVPANGSASIPIEFRPGGYGNRVGGLDISTSAGALCGSLPSVALHGYGFVSGKRFWGRQHRATYNSQVAPCVELDDGQLQCDGTIVGQRVSGDLLLPNVIANRACRRLTGTDVPDCYDFATATFAPLAVYTSIQESAGGYARFDDGTVGFDIEFGGSKITGLTDVVRVDANDSACALKSSGTIECWGFSQLLRTWNNGDPDVPSGVRVPITGVSDAKEFVLSPNYSWGEGVIVVHADGRVSVHRAADDHSAITEWVDGIPDAAEAVCIDGAVMVRRTSGTASWFRWPLENKGSLVPLTDVIDVAVGGGAATPLQSFQFLLADGRRFSSTSTDPGTISPVAGYDR